MLMRLHRTHTLFRTSATYLLILTSTVTVAMTVMRMFVLQTAGYRFLIWNLILAWIPFLCGLAMSALATTQRGQRMRMILICIWFLFLPNAPYLITDLVHLRPSTPMRWWYDLTLLALYGWNGMFLAVMSLRLMELRVVQLAGKWVGWLFVLTIIGIGSLGVAIGRLLRWNSWDLLVQPHLVLSDLATTHMDRVILALSAGVALIWLLIYLAIAGTALPGALRLLPNRVDSQR